MPDNGPNNLPTCDKCGHIVQHGERVVIIDKIICQYEGGYVIGDWQTLVVFCNACWPDDSKDVENLQFAAEIIR